MKTEVARVAPVRSIHMCFTLAVAMLSLLVLAMLGVIADLGVRHGVVFGGVPVAGSAGPGGVSAAPLISLVWVANRSPRSGHWVEWIIVVCVLLLASASTWLAWWWTGRTLHRLERQRRFAAMASHELRRPIAGLRLCLEEALLYPDVDRRDAITEALSLTGRLEAITNDVLLLARMGHIGGVESREPVDLGDLVTREASADAGGVPVMVNVDADVVVRASRIQMVRLVANLLSNARRHADAAVTVGVGRDGDQAVVTVTDDGPGIAPADRERVFERFTRLADGRRRDHGGTGLGLAICRDIVRAHDGSLRIEDSPRGARFVLRIPAEKTQVMGAAEATRTVTTVTTATTATTAEAAEVTDGLGTAEGEAAEGAKVLPLP
ncbi:HAMP domain-containing histidine kinase [Microbispora sp. RL4-1S]|uniref:histidine kinase n=1 Tax=Microbispora oryzae TaxID=2806554 RepID=A0A940WKJ2_9ACTN|nr:HAMP domain-containing sensor histidine kinase [Microbispora oryzae]MBP2706673.1 HAMP domain-containing histidine kinase [Microbispora oryzae]